MRWWLRIQNPLTCRDYSLNNEKDVNERWSSIHCGNIYSQRVMVGIPYFSSFFVTFNHLWRFSEITKRVNKTGHYVPCKVTLTISWINACKTRSVRNVIRCIFLWHKTARAPLMVLENYCELNRSRWVRCSTLLL